MSTNIPNVTFCSFWHPENACLPITMHWLGIKISSRLIQPSKARSGISVSVEGSTMRRTVVLLRKHSSSRYMTLRSSGMTHSAPP